jgi:uncharacterized membrane protein
MKIRRYSSRLGIVLAVVAVLALVLVPALALAGPRSGGSFGGRLGFRSSGGSSSSMPRNYSGGGYNRSYGGGGTSFFFFPGFGWGGGYGYGGGVGILGMLAIMAVAGVAVVAVARAVRRSRHGGGTPWGDDEIDEGPIAMPGRAYVYKLQLALGRSARGIQDRLTDFAARGDTSTEAGLATLLQQTALELLREKDSVRYALAEGRGPMSLTNAETAMNGVALSERARFQVERIRVADGRVARSNAVAEEGKEALELVVVTLIAATRTPLQHFATVSTPDELRALLAELGGVTPGGLLGLEVVWTPADSNDSMTETDVMTTYPELRSL